MSTRRFFTTLAAVGALFGWGLVRPAPAFAHCDSMDGPVVKAAIAAIQQQDVSLVLGWVRPGDEAEIRSAFARTLQARRAGGEARELADLWFHETLVRVHRAGEGAPYTGLKPAGTEPAPGIVAADRALEDGSGAALAGDVGKQVTGAIRLRYERVQALADHAPTDVSATRAWVHAYVEYIHFVEHIVGATNHGEEGVR